MPQPVKVDSSRSAALRRAQAALRVAKSLPSAGHRPEVLVRELGRLIEHALAEVESALS